MLLTPSTACLQLPDYTVVTHDDMTKHGFFGLSNHYCFLKIDFVKSRKMHVLSRSIGFPGRTGLDRSAARLKTIRCVYRTYIVHSNSLSGRLWSNISKTLVRTPACQIAKHA
jgi:hypothetical protein